MAEQDTALERAEKDLELPEFEPMKEVYRVLHFVEDKIKVERERNEAEMQRWAIDRANRLKEFRLSEAKKHAGAKKHMQNLVEAEKYRAERAKASMLQAEADEIRAMKHIDAVIRKEDRRAAKAQSMMDYYEERYAEAEATYYAAHMESMAKCEEAKANVEKLKLTAEQYAIKYRAAVENSKKK